MDWCEQIAAWVAVYWSTVVIDLILTIVLLYPILTFLSHGWQRRYEEISNLLSSDAKAMYLGLFHETSLQDGDGEDAGVKADRMFRDFYISYFGHRFFVLPTLLLAVVALSANFFVAMTLQELVRPGQTAPAFGAPAAAMTGAYAFICWDLIARMQRRNLSRGDIMRSALRLAMAVPVGIAFGAVVTPAVAPFVAFAIGFFPLQAIIDLVRRLARKQLQAESAETTRDHISVLVGIDNETALRIEDADITTVPQLAWCDPVQLTMRSNLQFAYVLDIVGQALAWVYLEDKLRPLSKLGLRGAIEIRAFADDLTVDDPPIQTAAAASLNAAADMVGVPADALRYTFEQISEDPMTKFMYEIWLSYLQKLSSRSLDPAPE